MKVLVAVDGSDCSSKAVEFLGERQWKLEDQFLVLSVVEPVPQEFGIGYLPPPHGAMEEREFEDSARFCGNAAATLQNVLPQNHVEVRVANGLVAETICHYAKEWDADLIVMGSHGRKGISHFLLGSVAEEVLKKSTCSVEIIKSKPVEKQAKQTESKTKNSTCDAAV